MSGTQGTSTTTQSNLPDFIVNAGYPQLYLSEAKALSITAYAPFSRYNDTAVATAAWSDGVTTYTTKTSTTLNATDNPTYAYQDANELLGILNLAARGRNGDTLITAAKTYINNILDGARLAGSDLDYTTLKTAINTKVANSYTADIFPKLGATMYYVGDPAPVNLAQNLTSSSVAKFLTRLFAEMDADNCQRERRVQEGSVNTALEFGRHELMDAEALRMSGVYAREYEQGYLADVFKKWTDEKMADLRRLDILGNAVRALVGTSSSQTHPTYTPSTLVSGAGGALAGAGMGANPALMAMTGGLSLPIGAVLGGIIGSIR